MYKYLLFWGLLLCCIPSLCAQEAITVRGRVTDTQGSPLLGVSVILEGTTKGASTNEKASMKFIGCLLAHRISSLAPSGMGLSKRFSRLLPIPQATTHTWILPYRERNPKNCKEVEIIGRRESSYKNTSSFSGTKTAPLSVIFLRQSIM